MVETHLQFMSGLDTVGGNIVVITYGDYQIISDFGAQVGVPSEALLDPNQTKHLLENQSLPWIEGVYGQDQLEDLELLAYESSSKKTIICLSHLHIDHIGSMRHLAPEIPIYCLEPCPAFYQDLVHCQQLPNYNLQLTGVVPDQVIEHGPFKIFFKESDHDTLGIGSIFIESPDCKLICSGDFRLTGYHPQRVLDWAIFARQWQADILLIEGTDFSQFPDRDTPLALELDKLTNSISGQTERRLLQNITQLMEEHSDQLIAFNGYPQNLERFVNLARSAQKIGRQVVVQETFYPLIKHIRDEEIELVQDSELVRQKIQQDPGDFMIQVDEFFPDYLQGLPQGIYLHSNGQPLGLYMPGYESFLSTIVASGWEFYHAHAFGHASQNDLLLVAGLVEAQITVPWHTLNPLDYSQALEAYGLRTWLPEKLKKYQIKNILERVNREQGGHEWS